MSAGAAVIRRTTIRPVVLFICFISSIAFVDGERCVQDNSCRCVYANGRGIDLSERFNDHDHDYIVSASLDNLTYYFHPCSDVHTLPYNATNATDSCSTGYSLCLFNKTMNGNVKLSVNADAKFTPADKPEINYLNFVHDKFTTSILLICVPDIAKTRLLANQPNDNSHSLILYTPAACLRELVVPGLSGFAVFLIIVVSVFLAYLSVGMLVNRIALGARGVEMIPNLAFWTSLPQRLMSGVDFVRNGCRRTNRSNSAQQLDPNSYDAI